MDNIQQLKRKKKKKNNTVKTPDRFIMEDIMSYLEDAVKYQEYFPTYEQLYNDSQEVIGLLEPYYRKYVDRLKRLGEILDYNLDKDVKRLYPIPKTAFMAKKIAKILIGYSI